MTNPGKYTAKAVAIRFVKPKDNLGVEIRFEFKNQDGGLAQLSWVGWLSERAMKNTMRTLVNVLGYNGDDETVNVPESDPSFGMIKNQDCIDRKKEVQLVIENETNPENEKVYPRIKWVNELGGGQFAGASPEVVKNDLNALGFKAAFLAQKAGKPSASTVEQASFAMPNEQDVPF